MSNLNFTTCLISGRSSGDVETLQLGGVSQVFRDYFIDSYDFGNNTVTLKFNFSHNIFNFTTFLDICHNRNVNLDRSQILNFLFDSDLFHCISLSKQFQSFVSQNFTIPEIIESLFKQYETFSTFSYSLAEIIAKSLNSIFQTPDFLLSLKKLHPIIIVNILSSPLCHFPPSIHLNEFLIQNYLSKRNPDLEIPLSIIKFINMKIITPQQFEIVSNFIQMNNLSNLTSLNCFSPTNLMSSQEIIKAYSNIGVFRSHYIKDKCDLSSSEKIIELFQTKAENLKIKLSKLKNENEKYKLEIERIKQLKESSEIYQLKLSEEKEHQDTLYMNFKKIFPDLECPKDDIAMKEFIQNMETQKNSLEADISQFGEKNQAIKTDLRKIKYEIIKQEIEVNEFNSMRSVNDEMKESFDLLRRFIRSRTLRKIKDYWRKLNEPIYVDPTPEYPEESIEMSPAYNLYR